MPGSRILPRLLVDRRHAHVELRVIAAGEAVVAAMGAAAIGVERPIERHPADRIQGRATGDFLIARAVGARVEADERVGPAEFDRAGHLTRRWRSRREIEQERLIKHKIGRNR